MKTASLVLVFIGLAIFGLAYLTVANLPAGLQPGDREAFDQTRILGACVSGVGMILFVMALKTRDKNKVEAANDETPS